MDDFCPPEANINRRLLEDTERAEGITKAAWQLEDAMSGRVVMDYPSDLKAREAYFDWARANRYYRMSIWGLYLLSMIEVPAWCDNVSNFYSYLDPSSRCQLAGVKSEDLLLSNVPYFAPAWTLVIEGVLVHYIFMKLLVERYLQVTYFGHLHVEYFDLKFDMKIPKLFFRRKDDFDESDPDKEKDDPYYHLNNNMLIKTGLAMCVFEVADMVVFILFRNPFRLAFIPRTAFMVFLPEVLTLFSSVATVIQEFVTIAVFFVSGILLFAWIATMLFDGLSGEVFGEDVTNGFDSFTNSLNTMFIAGATDDFFECFRNSYTRYRAFGLLWIAFLVVVHVLLLSLVLDTLVSAYTKLTEGNEEEGNRDKILGIRKSYNTLIATTGDMDGKVSMEEFKEFVAMYSRSPRIMDISQANAETIFAKITTKCTEEGKETKVDYIDKDDWENKLCGAMQLNFWVTNKYSPVREALPWVWENTFFAKLRDSIMSGWFDNWVMNNVLLVNLLLVFIETTYDLEHIPEAAVCKKLELIFSFVYLTECGLKLCVWSWEEYHSSGANSFDFITTWLLLGSSLLEEIAGSAGSLKRYMNVLRLLRLVRVIKQLKNIPQVIFMVTTIIRLVTEAKDILTLLLVVMYFFTSLSVQLFGGLLYKSRPELQDTEYNESDFWVLNFNDFLLAFGVWVVMLLCEYKAEFTTAIHRTSKIPCSFILFFIFYVFAVSIIFELVKAFTIEVFVTLHRENHDKQVEKAKRKKERRERRGIQSQATEKGSLSCCEPIRQKLFAGKQKKKDEDSESEDELYKGLKEKVDKCSAEDKVLHCQRIGDPRQDDKIQEALELEEKEKEEAEEEEEEGEEGPEGEEENGTN